MDENNIIEIIRDLFFKSIGEGGRPRYLILSCDAYEFLDKATTDLRAYTPDRPLRYLRYMDMAILIIPMKEKFVDVAG